MRAASPIVCVGEVLWDSLPAGLFLGGAALNIAHDLNALGLAAVLVSRIGDDVLGQEVRDRLRRLSMTTEGLQVSPSRPTGHVRVCVGEHGVPSFEIVENVAWDEIEANVELKALVARARGVIFGTLAQRAPASRAAIRAAWDCPGFKCCDVNLRPPFDNREITLESLEAADIVKLNHDELARVAGWLDMPADDEQAAMISLARRFRLDTLCVTRGEQGAALWHGGRYFSHPGMRVAVVDTVGAGDAFLAGLLDYLLQRKPPERALEWANACGAYVASKAGGTPAIERGAVEASARLPPAGG